MGLLHPLGLPLPRGSGTPCWTHPLTLLFPARQVTNVDDEGVELGSGVMELTQSELVLHLHRREAVRWPYLCLRRYGYDSNLFSFESGRRCQTGQGEYSSCRALGRGLVHLCGYQGRKPELGPVGEPVDVAGAARRGEA